MSTKKSEIIKKLSDNYPNFIKKDLIKFIEIITTEIKNSLRRKERVELRDVFSMSQDYRKKEFQEIKKLMKSLVKKNIL